MRTPRLWLGISNREWLINSKTPHCYVGVFTAEVDEFDSFGRAFDKYDIDSSYASAAAAQFVCAQMVGRIASNAYSARSYPDGRVLIPREAGQPDDETTLVFDLSITLHYSRHEISAVDKLWVSSPHVSEDDVLSVTALALDSHSFACPRPSDAANSVTVEHKTFQDYLATQGVRMTNRGVLPEQLETRAAVSGSLSGSRAIVCCPCTRVSAPVILGRYVTSTSEGVCGITVRNSANIDSLTSSIQWASSTT